MTTLTARCRSSAGIGTSFLVDPTGCSANTSEAVPGPDRRLRPPAARFAPMPSKRAKPTAKKARPGSGRWRNTAVRRPGPWRNRSGDQPARRRVALSAGEPRRKEGSPYGEQTEASASGHTALAGAATGTTRAGGVQDRSPERSNRFDGWSKTVRFDPLWTTTIIPRKWRARNTVGNKKGLWLFTGS